MDYIVTVDGMTAANDLGLTDAVPARITVFTDARLRPITLGKLTIEFRHPLRRLRRRLVSILGDPSTGKQSATI